MRASALPTSPVETLGRYTLVSQIASGGMATVFLATAKGPGGFEKVFAVKRIHPHLAEQEDFVNMFLDEARIASRIHHSNCCQVFDFGQADGTYYIAMEYLLGEALAKIMKATRKREELFKTLRYPMLAVKVVADACEGLHAAHELKGRDGEYLNVVHRDISPQNLFVTYEGNVKVVDFGIASASDRVHQTSAGQVKGKFSYMAPEQSRGSAIDRRADVFALGVVLWELLTLRRLFRRETTVETLTAMLNEPIVPPSTVASYVPKALDTIVLKALARDPDDRYESAREFGRDLVRFAGRTGQPAGMADLADWMDTLFPDGRNETNEMVAAAQRGDFDRTMIVTEAELEQSNSQLESVPAIAGVMSAPSSPAPVPSYTPTPGAHPSLTPSPTPTPSFAPTEAKKEEDRGKGVVYAILGTISLLAILATVIVVAFLMSQGNDPITDRVATNGTIANVPADPTPEPATMEVVTPMADPPDPSTPMVAEATMTEPEDEPDRQDRRDRDSRRDDRRNMDNRASMDRRVAAATMADMTEAPMAQATSGSVFILTPGGWATIIDGSGRPLGQTPRRVQLPVGTHRLQLRYGGQPPGHPVRVTVRPGETTRVVHRIP
ncbi:MAG: protein kinase [Myxococcota bacterium]